MWEDFGGEQLEEPMHINGCLFRVARYVVTLIDIGESNINRLINK